LDFFKSRMQAAERFKRLRTATTCRVCHLSTPPPKGDNAYVESRIRDRYRDRSVAEAGINAPGLRLRLWQIEMRALRAICIEQGVEFLEAPREALTTDGFLHPRYYADDVTHANEAYGELVVRQIEAVLKHINADTERGSNA